MAYRSAIGPLHPADEPRRGQRPKQPCNDVVGKLSEFADVANLQDDRNGDCQNRIDAHEQKQSYGADKLSFALRHSSVIDPR